MTQAGMPETVSSLERADVRFVVGWHLKAAGYCPLHHHPTMEIVFHARGNGRAGFGDEVVLDFGPMDVMIYPPEMLHDQTNDTIGEDRCIHLHGHGVDLGGPACIQLSRLNDAYAVRELTALSEAKPPVHPMEATWLNHRAHALLAYLLLCAERRQRATHTGNAANYAELALDFVSRHAGAIATLQEVADHVGVSPDYLRHVFRDRYGMSLKRWHVLARIELAKKVLMYSALPVKTVAAECGFATDRHFCTSFRAEVGMTPRRFREATSSGEHSSRSALDGPGGQASDKPAHGEHEQHDQRD